MDHRENAQYITQYWIVIILHLLISLANCLSQLSLISNQWKEYIWNQQENGTENKTSGRVHAHASLLE